MISLPQTPQTFPNKRIPVFGTLTGWADLPVLGGRADRGEVPVEKEPARNHYQDSFQPAKTRYTPRVEINKQAVIKAIREGSTHGQELSARAKRFTRQYIAKKVLPGERVEKCFDLAFGSKAHVCYSKEHEAAHVKGVMVCGSVWACPVCSRKVSKRRLDELTTALAGSEYGQLLVTLTIQHSKKDKLKRLLDDLAEGVRKLRQGRQWGDFSDGLKLVGSVTNLEETYSSENGHHPHKHILFLSKLPQSELNKPENRAKINTWLAIYRAFLTSKGYHVNEHTTDVKTNHDDIAGYLVKWAFSQEVVLSDMKEGSSGHYSPFQLLDLIRQGKTEYIDVFREYFYAFKGRKQLSFSRGLRKLLGLGKEAEDRELAEDEEKNTDTITLVSLEPRQYKVILGRAIRGELGRLLDVASKNNVFKLWEYLHELGIEPTQKQLDFLSLQLSETG